jgi:DNA-binding MarR family transcriptional regulator
MKMAVIKEFESSRLTIKFEEWLNLLPIVRLDGISQKEIARSLGKDKTTISRLIDGLIRKGLVIRKESKVDRRSLCLHLTKKGIELHKQALPIIKKCDLEFQDKLTKKESDLLNKILFKLHC